MKPPAATPCNSCPYRRDVPSGVWDASEYDKLPAYDAETFAKPPGVFLCHQQDGRICSGWAGCHDMGQSLAIRLAACRGELTGDDLRQTLGHKAAVPLFRSGRAARNHGIKGIKRPGKRSRAVIEKLITKRARKGQNG